MRPTPDYRLADASDVETSLIPTPSSEVRSSRASSAALSARIANDQTVDYRDCHREAAAPVGRNRGRLCNFFPSLAPSRRTTRARGSGGPGREVGLYGPTARSSPSPVGSPRRPNPRLVRTSSTSAAPPPGADPRHVGKTADTGDRGTVSAGICGGTTEGSTCPTRKRYESHAGDHPQVGRDDRRGPPLLHRRDRASSRERELRRRGPRTGPASSGTNARNELLSFLDNHRLTAVCCVLP